MNRRPSADRVTHLVPDQSNAVEEIRQRVRAAEQTIDKLTQEKCDIIELAAKLSIFVANGTTSSAETNRHTFMEYLKNAYVQIQLQQDESLTDDVTRMLADYNAAINRLRRDEFTCNVEQAAELMEEIYSLPSYGPQLKTEMHIICKAYVVASKHSAKTVCGVLPTTEG